MEVSIEELVRYDPTCLPTGSSSYPSTSYSSNPSTSNQRRRKYETPPKAKRSKLADFYLDDTSVFTLSDYDDDVDYIPMKTSSNPKIRIGEDYQCSLDYTVGDKTPEDELMWKPTPDLSEEKIKDYLNTVNHLVPKPEDECKVENICLDTQIENKILAHEELMSRTNNNEEVPDNVEALKKLMDHNYNVPDAIENIFNPSEIQIINEQFAKCVYVCINNNVPIQSIEDYETDDDEEPPTKKVKK